MSIDIDTIVYYVRMLATNFGVFYVFSRILNIKDNLLKNFLVLTPINLGLIFAYVPLRIKTDSLFPFIILYLLYSVILSRITKTKLGYTMFITVISYALTFLCQGLSVIIQFVPYKVLYKLLKVENRYLSLIMICIIQFLILYLVFRIKKLRNGFVFLNNKLNTEVTDLIILNLSMVIIMTYCLLENYQLVAKQNLFMTFCILVIIMFFTIQKMFTMYYKQKLLTDTMEEYKKELAEKQNEIDSLKQDKKDVSKITHEFYNRQKALELLVASNMNSDNIDKENISPNVLKIIESLTNEYSERFEQSKELPKLDETGIPEIDNMFKYMQSECCSNNINFNLKIMGNIHYLVNNIIPKNKLETLIGDHLRDAINAVNLIDEDNKEILAILGIKNKKYEFSVYDNGVDFTIDTLMKLGLESVTTNAERGGTGTGFMTTFETLAETKASLIITEYPKTKDNTYTKCVTIKFDGKKQYKIVSYRSEELKLVYDSKRIKIEEIKGK